ncbi:MAG: glycosyltransferase [Cytophagales bacterium]|jgi:glycosyltransferase involved in cell wall biosynthesis|nr:glycosyltransferase [Cytophagales bacterium]
MKILHVCYADNGGGADNAAFRLCKAQRSIGIDARMLVVKKRTQHSFVQPAIPDWRQLEFKIRDRLVQKIVGLMPLANPTMHSVNVFPSFLHRKINQSGADIVNLHWVGKEMISISEIGRIRKPIVWTVHDSWTFCGAEHHPHGLQDNRFADGYEDAAQKPFDLNRWTWQRKADAWKRLNLQVVGPSRWIAAMAQKSKLLKSRPVHNIPNPLDTNVFCPGSKSKARALFNLPLDKKIVLFGSLRSAQDSNKGMDLLVAALGVLKEKHGSENTLAVIFGMTQDEETVDIGFPRQYVGKINGEERMAMLYAAADVMVVPSRMENLPQTATEPMACGTPVVGFDIGGMPDIIRHRHNGYLAVPYDPSDLASGIAWAINHPDHAQLSENARMFALENFSESGIASRYVAIYEHLLYPDSVAAPGLMPILNDECVTSNDELTENQTSASIRTRKQNLILG